MSQTKNIQIERRWIFLDEKNIKVPKWEGINPEISAILFSRGIKSNEEAELFLYPKYENLSDPYELPDMEKAVSKISAAIKGKKKIVVYGDYDVDGVAATALMCSFLKQVGANFDSYIPSREGEGYGLNSTAIEELIKKGAELLITVDCGTTSIAEIEKAKATGLEIVVTDHHALKVDKGKDVLPDAVAVINPKRSESKIKEELAGVGVAFYLVKALQNKFLDLLPEGQEKWFLDLVALGTICDVVPLTGQNRILAHFGLRVLAKTKRIGLKALAQASEFDIEGTTSYQVGFLLGPRLNAAGRLKTASSALKLLLTEDENEAKELSNELNKLNRERQVLTERIAEEAKQAVDSSDLKNIYLLKNEKWPAGVIGIVASRLVEAYNRPFLLMEERAGILKGSARSIKDFNITEALAGCSEHLIQYGGHAYAAGFKLKSDHFVLLENKLIEISKERIKEIDLVPRITIDQKILLEQVDDELIAQLKLLAPFGQGNPKPVFALIGVAIKDMRLVGNNANHLKMVIENTGQTLSGMAFNYGKELGLKAGDSVDIACNLEENIFRNVRTLEFVATGIRLNK